MFAPDWMDVGSASRKYVRISTCPVWTWWEIWWPYGIASANFARCYSLLVSGTPGMDLTRVHHPGQYLIKSLPQIWIKNCGSGFIHNRWDQHLQVTFLFFRIVRQQYGLEPCTQVVLHSPCGFVEAEYVWIVAAILKLEIFFPWETSVQCQQTKQSAKTVCVQPWLQKQRGYLQNTEPEPHKYYS